MEYKECSLREEEILAQTEENEVKIETEDGVIDRYIKTDEIEVKCEENQDNW